MKKYITGGIAALITLTAICMMTGQSQASPISNLWGTPFAISRIRE
ncbi:hypothetical protein [Akkermansia muciniphila]|nr:hypothetical protein [Akkermansia muciniphila]